MAFDFIVGDSVQVVGRHTEIGEVVAINDPPFPEVEVGYKKLRLLMDTSGQFLEFFDNEDTLSAFISKVV